MKTVVIALLLLIASYCIDAKCPKCNSDSCLGCTKYSNCVWCDGNCQSKFSKIACSSRIDAPENCTPGCDYNGKHYSIGDSFMDDCNSCSCNEDGSVVCTLMACTPGCEAALCPVDTYCEEDADGNPVCKPLATCDYNDVTYNDGDSFPSTDGCNQCSCTNGRVICTLRFCKACQTNDDCESDSYCKKDSCDDTQTGSCSVRIEFCNEQHDQVCGCDGQTYPNGCVAASAGVNIKSDGPCEGGSEGDCSSADDCGSGKYCKKDSCDNSLRGSCSEMSVFCTEQYDPVCGCDGQTYGNDCEAAGAGVNVNSKGECEGGSQGDCSSNRDCDSGYYCAKNSCNDTEGTCTQNTDLCNTLYDPVCGCDGHTYGNGCEAANAGVNVKNNGECEGSPETCKTNNDCDTNHYCKKDSCDDTLAGTCDQRTIFCNKIYSPVCGCDGQTYGNGCEAAGAGVNIKSKGECEGGSQGDCSSNSDCDSGYCAKNSCGATKGTCTQNTDLCNTLYDPVCGCDGHTYGNGCEAARAGVNVKSNGECEGGSTGTCHTNDDCESGYYCEKESCGDDAQGYCTENFDVCAEISNPVCGCDGNTYGNACEAASGGVNVDYEGECSGGSQGSCQSNNDCEGSCYCAKNSCGDTKGTCTQNTDLCNTLYDPVCGCDGQTYGNGCEAARAGVNVKSNGECDGGSEGDCSSADDCGSGKYCKKDSCDNSLRGSCSEMSVFCTEQYDPVCGCDGQTYGNDCEAAGAGVNVNSRGECEGGSQGDCEANDDCNSGYYCAKSACDSAYGTCTLKMDLCNTLYDPVCGCDNHTYGNACSANNAGVNVKSQGECPGKQHGGNMKTNTSHHG